VRLDVALLVFATTVGTAAAATGIVAERRETMKSFSVATRVIAEMFAGKQPYDYDRFKAAADLIRGKSGAALRAEFPSGSIGEGSRAKPEIFAEWPEFTQRTDQLALLADGLSKAAGRSPHAIGSDMRMTTGMPMGGSLLASRAKPLTETEISSLPAEHVFHLMIEQCTGCHAKFRTADE
jgi:cytochrome c556